MLNSSTTKRTFCGCCQRAATVLRDIFDRYFYANFGTLRPFLLSSISFNFPERDKNFFYKFYPCSTLKTTRTLLYFNTQNEKYYHRKKNVYVSEATDSRNSSLRNLLQCVLPCISRFVLLCKFKRWANQRDEIITALLFVQSRKYDFRWLALFYHTLPLKVFYSSNISSSEYNLCINSMIPLRKKKQMPKRSLQFTRVYGS